MKLKIKGKAYEVATLEEASKLYEKLRDASGLGASRWPSGSVFEGRELAATISYNGRVWPPGNWTADSVPLYDNRNVALNVVRS